MLSMDGPLHLFSRDELSEIVYEPGSLMPSDYESRLPAKEMQDLLAFLSRLGSTTPTEQGGRRHLPRRRGFSDGPRSPRPSLEYDTVGGFGLAGRPRPAG